MRTALGSIQIRIYLAGLVMGAGMSLLVCYLWRVQVGQGEEYRSRLIRQSTRRVRLPALRGRIYDRNGAVLAANRPSYCLAIHLEELRERGPWSRTVARVDELLSHLSQKLGLPRQVGRKEIERHVRQRLPLPLIAWRDLDDVAVARWAEQASDWRGVELVVDPVRTYPFGELFCHVIGYVGRKSIPAEPAEQFDYYLPDYEGRRGIEKRYDDLLRGRAGGKVVLVDAVGYRYSDLAVKPPTDGKDIFLTLDHRIQQAAWEALTGKAGAVVVMDPTNGAIEALVSTPGFDPNRFIPAIPAAEWDMLLQDPQKPLLNRAVAGAYVPGSTIKPVVAIAGLKSGKVRAQTQYVCRGFLDLGRWRFKCWYKRGHGELELPQGIRYSCNVYFYRLALECGADVILEELDAVGLGQRTGVDLDYELAGRLPDKAWHRRRFGRPWSDGDTCNLAIGQGALVVTPLQLAVAAAAIANGGTVVRPHLLARVGDSESEEDAASSYAVRRLNWNPAWLAPVREGMREVIMARDGTGRLAAVPGIEMAGKTGTAQYGPPDNRKNYCWMVAYWPYRQPRHVICVVIDEGESGGHTAAPVVRRVVEAIEKAG